MFDFIIVGGGLAGVTFAHTLERYGRSFCLISDRSQAASLVAAGAYNPVVLKRFTPIWMATELRGGKAQHATAASDGGVA